MTNAVRLGIILNIENIVNRRRRELNIRECNDAHIFPNTLRPRQHDRHYPGDILKCMFLNKNVWIFLTISLKCVRKVRISNVPSLVQIMAWRRPGDKPLSEPMIVDLLTHICVTRPQWVDQSNFGKVYTQKVTMIIIVLTDAPAPGGALAGPLLTASVTMFFRIFIS